MLAPISFLQNSFSGGLNQQIDASRLKANEYSLLVNGRTRYDTVDPIHSPIDVTPAGLTKLQGCYAAGSIVVLFADGLAFYRDFSSETGTFAQIPGFLMSPDVDVFHAVLIPASTINGFRKLANDANTSAGVNFSGTGSSSPQAILIQDGINQPRIILANGLTRETGVYNSWTQTIREYVPVGKQMLWHNGILYIVSPDGTQIFRSVTGRPLDFMVIIDSAGDKLPNETDGGAASISHKVDYAAITALAPLSSPEGDFFVSTARTSYSVRPQFNSTPYGEPYFSNGSLFTTGAVNNFSFCDILGDNAVVDYSGIRSFNSVGQYRIEGRNSPFSAKIDRLISGKKQTNPACISFDNYGLFSVDTIFGRGIFVYDTLIKEWVSLDLMTALSDQVILMFAEAKTSATRKLFCVTSTKLYELYPDTGPLELPGYYTPEFNSGDMKISQVPTMAQVGFVDVLGPGSVYITPICDGQVQPRLRRSITSVQADLTVLPYPPVQFGAKDKVRAATFALLNGEVKSCWKFGVFVQWTFNAKMSSVFVKSNSQTMDVSFEEQSNIPPKIDVEFIYQEELVANGFLNVFGNNVDLATSVVVNGLTIVDRSVIDSGWIQVQLPSAWISGTVVTLVELRSDSEYFIYSTESSATARRDNPLPIISVPDGFIASFPALTHSSVVIKAVRNQTL